MEKGAGKRRKKREEMELEKREEILKKEKRQERETMKETEKGEKKEIGKGIPFCGIFTQLVLLTHKNSGVSKPFV